MRSYPSGSTARSIPGRSLGPVRTPMYPDGAVGEVSGQHEPRTEVGKVLVCVTGAQGTNSSSRLCRANWCPLFRPPERKPAMRERMKPILGALVVGYVVNLAGIIYFFGPIAANDMPAGPIAPGWLSLLIAAVLLVLLLDWVAQAVGSPVRSAMIIAVSPDPLGRCLLRTDGRPRSGCRIRERGPTPGYLGDYRGRLRTAQRASDILGPGLQDARRDVARALELMRQRGRERDYGPSR